MQPLSLGRLVLIMLPGSPEGVYYPTLRDEFGALLEGRRRSDERHYLGEPRERAAYVTRVWGDSCANVTVMLDAANDARTQADVNALRMNGFDVSGVGALFAGYSSASLGNGIGGLRWPPFVAPKPAGQPSMNAQPSLASLIPPPRVYPNAEDTPVDGTRLEPVTPPPG